MHLSSCEVLLSFRAFRGLGGLVLCTWDGRAKNKNKNNGALSTMKINSQNNVIYINVLKSCFLFSQQKLNSINQSINQLQLFKQMFVFPTHCNESWCLLLFKPKPCQSTGLGHTPVGLAHVDCWHVLPLHS